MTAQPTLTLKHEHDDGTTTFVGATSVQRVVRGNVPYLLIEVPGDDSRRECYGGRAYLMNAQGKTIEVFNLDLIPTIEVESLDVAPPAHPYPAA